MTIADYEAPTLENLSPVQVGPGCLRWNLPATAGVRAWIVDIEPGAQWPHVDQHDGHGEQVWVISGEMIEGDRKSTRLNSSHVESSYAVFCLKKKKTWRGEVGSE